MKLKIQAKIFLTSVYPNPVNDFLSFNYNLSAPSKVELTLMDTSGKTVYKKVLPYGVTGNNHTSIDVKILSKGFYTMLLKSHSQTCKAKFLKE